MKLAATRNVLILVPELAESTQSAKLSVITLIAHAILDLLAIHSKDVYESVHYDLIMII